MLSPTSPLRTMTTYLRDTTAGNPEFELSSVGGELCPVYYRSFLFVIGFALAALLIRSSWFPLSFSTVPLNEPFFHTSSIDLFCYSTLHIFAFMVFLQSFIGWQFFWHKFCIRVAFSFGPSSGQQSLQIELINWGSKELHIHQPIHLFHVNFCLFNSLFELAWIFDESQYRNTGVSGAERQMGDFFPIIIDLELPTWILFLHIFGLFCMPSNGVNCPNYHFKPVNSWNRWNSLLLRASSPSFEATAFEPSWKFTQVNKRPPRTPRRK